MDSSKDIVRDHRKNNFDFLRIAAALLVLFSHQYALSGLPEPAIFGMSAGTFAVLVFFSISGFLVSQSWRQDANPLRFLAKRFLRIWPGLAAATLLTAFVLGPAVSSLDAQAYFSHPALTDFLRNLKITTVRYFLPGVFEDNIYPKAVNGSLWTIPLEVRCYFALLVAGCLGLMRKPVLVVLATFALGIHYFAFNPDPNRYQVHFGLYFFAGVCLDLFRRHWEGKSFLLLAIPAAIALALHAAGLPQLALVLVVPCAAILIGCQSTPGLKDAGKYGDISYGIYIYAFPVQQTVLWALDKDTAFASGLALAVLMTVFCALLSWHLVESPALRLKSYLPQWPTLPWLSPRMKIVNR
ncbi:acyltransferase family protein [Noviherbaspirillum aerium]|uniref:acyltransferase family protein n=1 Tax=Noviherbaspirillum aerium TaxID=2588497 RepID=UPI00124DE274|nr:acyltransferase [Noviherbaspirillum aerium]